MKGETSRHEEVQLLQFGCSIHKFDSANLKILDLGSAAFSPVRRKALDTHTVLHVYCF